MVAELEGKVCVVTGAAFGIGRAIALACARAGADAVVVADLGSEARGGKRTASDVCCAGEAAATFVSCDVSDGKAVAALMERAAREFGRIDVVYANAGISGGGGWAHEVADDDFARVLSVNLAGVFHTAKYALPYLIETKGVIVNTASSFGMVGAHFCSSYAAAKGGVINLTRQLATDYGPLGVRVLAICPGFVGTVMGRTVPGLDSPHQLPQPTERRAGYKPVSAEAAELRWANREAAAAMQPLPRQCAPSEIASAAIFLASPAASFMTGTIVPVDGGCTATIAGSDVQTNFASELARLQSRL